MWLRWKFQRLISLKNMETIIENIKDINYFELFSLKQDLDPDLEELELKYFQLQERKHAHYTS